MNSWFSTEISTWYLKNKRDLPWRDTRDPYKIWLSEVILQQTQVAQGLSYYNRFTERYPTVTDLANAQEDEVLKLWEGLGYYSRARNLHFSAKFIQNELEGEFPKEYQAIKDLKGIGNYTAAAIASFAYDLPFAVVDGNVYRVLSRIFGVAEPIDNNKGKMQFQELANSLLNKNNPALHNQAIMEFGSQYCRPVNPDCENCIFSAKCFAFLNKRVADLPVKSKKTAIRKRFFNYVIVADKKGNVLLNRREKKDIWHGLYEFCLIESKKELSAKTLLSTPDFKQVCKSTFDLRFTSKSYKHVLTHQHLYSKFYVVSTNRISSAGYKKRTVAELEDLAFPRLIEKFMHDCDLKEIL